MKQNLFKRIASHKNWSFYGVILALGIIIYQQYFIDKRPRIIYEIMSNTRILDVKEDLSKLNILFDGIDIKKQNLSLRVLLIRISNSSSIDVLKNYFDNNDPLGIELSTGKVVQLELVRTSNAYLQKNIGQLNFDETKVVFPSFILDAGAFFTIKLVVLHDEGLIPTISSTGKVAGVKIIPVVDVLTDLNEKTFINQTFYGSEPIQIVRIIVYFFIGLFIIFVIAFVSDKVSKIFALHKRKKLIQSYKESATKALNKTEHFIFDEFIQKGWSWNNKFSKADGSDDVSDGKYTIGEIKITDDRIVSNDHLKEVYIDFIKFLQSRKFPPVFRMQTMSTVNYMIETEIKNVEAELKNMDAVS